MTGAFSKLRAVYRKCAWLAGRLLAVDGGVLNITAVAWTAGFQWWRSGDITRTQNVSEYMLVLALCLVIIVIINFLILTLGTQFSWKKNFAAKFKLEWSLLTSPSQNCHE